MADVRPSVPDGNRSGADRGQLLMVGALALAVILVALALLLNTAIYTGNIATRDPGPGTTAVVEYENAVAAMAEGTIHGVNRRNNTTYADLEAAFREGVAAWSTTAVEHAAMGGVDAHTETVGTVEGTRIVQDTSGEFRNASGAAAWKLATDARARNFTMRVDAGSLVGTDADDLSALLDTFTVDVTDENGDTWSVSVYRETDAGGNVTVEVVSPDDSRASCTTTADQATVDLTTATLEGRHCDALTFWEEANAPYNISYENGDKVNGTYGAVVDVPLSALDTDDYHADGSGSDPYVTPAIYSADLRLVYRSPVGYYRSQVRIAPGEPDA